MIFLGNDFTYSVACEPHLCAWDDRETDHPGRHTKAHEEQMSDLWQYSFTKGWSCLTSVVAFYDWVMALVDKGKATDVIYLELHKAFNMVSYCILILKL